MTRLRAAALCTLVFFAVVPTACGPSSAVSKGAARPITEWVGQDADLFDDGIDVGAIPVSVVGSTNNDPFRADDTNDEKVGERLERADTVVSGKIIGVTSEPVGDKHRYRLELNLDPDPLAGARIDSPLVLAVEPTAPAFGTIRSLEGQLMGRKFIVYLRRYAGEEGAEPINHFHISPDNAHVRSLIDRANTIHKVEGG